MQALVRSVPPPRAVHALPHGGVRGCLLRSHVSVVLLLVLFYRSSCAVAVRVAVGDEHVCCRTCWPELRSELNRAASKIVAPDVFETYAVDIAYGDQFLVMLKPGDHVSLPEQSRAALKVARVVVVCSCSLY